MYRPFISRPDFLQDETTVTFSGTARPLISNQKKSHVDKIQTIAAETYFQSPIVVDSPSCFEGGYIQQNFLRPQHVHLGRMDILDINIRMAPQHTQGFTRHSF